MKKETESKEIEIEVLTTEIVEQLDDSVKEDVVLLSERLGTNGMLPLNPLVYTFQDLLRYKDLAYEKTTNEDGKEEDNSQAYKDAKGDIRSFRATVGKTKKQMKADIIATGRALDNIEKTFIEKATEIHDELDANFKEYLDEQQAKKDAAAAKKEAARNAEIEKLNAEKNDALLKAKKAGALNKIKYDVILAYKEKKNNELATLNVKAIDHNISKWNSVKLFQLVLENEAVEDWDLLEDHEHLTLATQFRSVINDLTDTYEARKVLVAEEDQKRAEELAEQRKEALEQQPLPTLQAVKEVEKIIAPATPPAPPRQEEAFKLSTHNLDFLNQQDKVSEIIKYFEDFIKFQNPPATIATMVIDINKSLKEAADSIDDLIM